MAQVTMTLDVGPHVDTAGLQDWMRIGLAIEEDSRVGDDEIEAAGQVEGRMQAASLPLDNIESARPAPPARTGGRKTTAQKTAERIAAEAAANGTGQEPAGTAQPIPPAPPAPSAGMALPPGVTAHGASPTPLAQPEQQQLTPSATAMPKPATDLPTEINGVVPLEIFREAYRAHNMTKPGKCNIIMKATKWSDGVAKTPIYTLEGIPEADRQHYLMEWDMML